MRYLLWCLIVFAMQTSVRLQGNMTSTMSSQAPNISETTTQPSNMTTSTTAMLNNTSLVTGSSTVNFSMATTTEPSNMTTNVFARSDITNMVTDTTTTMATIPSSSSESMITMTSMMMSTDMTPTDNSTTDNMTMISADISTATMISSTTESTTIRYPRQDYNLGTATYALTFKIDNVSISSPCNKSELKLELMTTFEVNKTTTGFLWPYIMEIPGGNEVRLIFRAAVYERLWNNATAQVIDETISSLPVLRNSSCLVIHSQEYIDGIYMAFRGLVTNACAADNICSSRFQCDQNLMTCMDMCEGVNCGNGDCVLSLTDDSEITMTCECHTDGDYEYRGEYCDTRMLREQMVTVVVGVILGGLLLIFIIIVICLCIKSRGGWRSSKYNVDNDSYNHNMRMSKLS